MNIIYYYCSGRVGLLLPMSGMCNGVFMGREDAAILAEFLSLRTPLLMIR